ncbi:SEC31_4 [Sanghuangporus weigelae]
MLGVSAARSDGGGRKRDDAAEIVGELPYAANWAFQAQWCPRGPDPLATACFDGTIGIHSIQTTNEAAEAQAPAATPKPDGSDVFDFARTTQPTLSLRKPPKWLRRPTSAPFGYGEKLKKSADAEARQVHDTASWKALASLLKADPREELVTLLGFSKADIAARVVEAVEKIKWTAIPTQPPAEELSPERTEPLESVVSFAEPETEPEHEQEHTPYEQSTSVVSDHATDATGAIDGESTTRAPSLFGDDIGTPQMDAEADLFNGYNAQYCSGRCPDSAYQLRS